MSINPWIGIAVVLVGLFAGAKLGGWFLGTKLGRRARERRDRALAELKNKAKSDK